MQKDMLFLTPSQKEASDLAASGKDLLITGGAGTGKSFILRLIIDRLSSSGKKILLCASTGTAALQIGGTTIHRAFGLRSAVCINEKTMTLISNVPEHLLHTDTVVIDEISMCRMDLMDAVLLSLRKAERKTGRAIQLILCGDFYQLPPVMGGTQGDRRLLEHYYKGPVGNAYAFQASAWKRRGFRTVLLTDTIRQKDPVFIAQLDAVRTGSETDIQYFRHFSAAVPFQDAVWLFPCNSQSDLMNRKQMESLPGDLVQYETLSEGRVSGSDLAGIPPVLELKVNARIMVTVNSPDLGTGKASYHNGSTGIVETLGKDVISVRLDNGHRIRFQRKEYRVIRYTSDDKGDLTKETVGIFRQFPLRPAYALTIHKAQGKTLEKVNVCTSCRQPGQLYTALSRVTDIRNMYIEGELPPHPFIDPAVERFYNASGQEQVLTEPDPALLQQKECVGEVHTGRPRRYPNGSVTIRVPSELADGIRLLISRVCPSSPETKPDMELFQNFIRLCNQP